MLQIELQATDRQNAGEREMRKKRMALYKELKPEELEGVNGGYLCSPNGTCNTLVIDDRTGEELARFGNIMYASMYCQEHGISTTWISERQLESLRNGGQV